jgi:hypothetical protein
MTGIGVEAIPLKVPRRLPALEISLPDADRNAATCIIFDSALDRTMEAARLSPKETAALHVSLLAGLESKVLRSTDCGFPWEPGKS